MRIQEPSSIGEGSISNLSAITRRTESMENSATEATLGASMDFDRHSVSTHRYHLSAKYDDSGSLNWEDSFAMDDAAHGPEVRPVCMQRVLDTVMEPEDEDSKDRDDEPRATTSSKTSGGSDEQMQVEQAY